MASLTNADGPNEPIKTDSLDDFAHAETQVFDSQFSPPPSLGERVEDGNDNQLHLEDAHETQGVSLAGETQALNLDSETQALGLNSETQALNFEDETLTLNVGGETQALDCFDGIEFIRTQLLDVSDNEFANNNDNEGSNRADVLVDGDGISDDDSARRDSKQSLEKQKMLSSFVSEQGERNLNEKHETLKLGAHDSTATPVVQVTPQREAGSVPRFTSIRAASLRASALAAHSMALKEINSESCYVLTNGLFSDQDAVRSNGLEPKVTEEIGKIIDFKDSEKEKRIRNGNMCRIGSSAVRKLFAEDPLPLDEGIRNGNSGDGGENLLQFLHNDDDLGRLSYIDSQEPGELSQANALKFVEVLIEKSNLFEFDHEDNHGKSIGGKSKPISTAKGPQTLAKKSNDRCTVGNSGIFDWDDSREDEGGGDIFCRRKKEFCDTGHYMQRSSTKSQKLKKRKLDAYRDNVEQEGAQCKIVVHSGSRVKLHNMKKNEKKAEDTELRLEKDLVNEFNEELNVEASRQQTEADVSMIDLPQILNVGPDTQMAAEAMEALLSGEGIPNHDVNCFQSESDCSAEGSSRGKSKLTRSSSQATVCFSDLCVATRRKKDTPSLENFKNFGKKCDTEPKIKRKKRAKSTAKGNSSINGSKNVDEVPSIIIGRAVDEGPLKSSQLKEIDRCLGTATQDACHSTKKQRLTEELRTYTPIACRTRRSMLTSQSKGAEHIPDNYVEDVNHLMEVGAFEESRTDGAGVYASEICANQSGEVENHRPNQPEYLDQELAISTGAYTFRHPRGRRSCRKLSCHVLGYDKFDFQSKTHVLPEDIRQSITGHKSPKSYARSISINSTMKRKTRSCVHAFASLSSLDRSMDGKLLEKSLKRPDLKYASLDCGSSEMNGKMKSTDITRQKALKRSGRNGVIDPQPSAVNAETNSRSDKCPRAHTSSPVNCLMPGNAASPVCTGNGYVKQSGKNLSKTCLMKELSMLIATEQEPISPLKELRKRRDVTSVRVLFSQHLDEDIIKQQRKILVRLGASIATSIADATHFVTDNFVRTRNMLEAIASGKPVVTHLWLESIGQVKVHIDEEAYLLRDMKKEKEFCFSMPASLARARKHPLLQGRRVLITQNIKPSKETISTLVKVVHGQPVERIGRSTLKDHKIPADLLILSCEEDYEICEPFLEKGAAVYSSELLLNGIVTQKLEYERHRLFADNVKRTRSTIWLRKDGLNFHPVTKLK